MAELRLYHAVPSRSMIVRWMLEEVGEPFDIELLSLENEDHKTPEYLAVNPLGRVPALTRGETVVTETAAIVAWLAEQYPAAGLDVPADSPHRAEYLRWMFFAPVSAEPSVLWSGLGEAVASLPYQPWPKVEEVADVLADAVRDREFVVGDRFTAADVMVGSTVMWGLDLIRVMPEKPKLRAYWSGLSARPAWQRAHEADNALLDAKAG